MCLSLKPLENACGMIQTMTDTVDHLKSQWIIYQNAQLLPDTNIFEKLKEQLEEQKGKLQRLLSQLENESQEKNTNISFLDIPHLLLDKIHNLSTKVLSLQLYFMSRVAGAIDYDTSLGMKSSTFRFRTEPLLHNISDVLINDYLEFYSEISTGKRVSRFFLNLLNLDFQGISIFGYLNHSVSLPDLEVIFLPYLEIENNLERLVILPHEVAHLFINKIKMLAENKVSVPSEVKDHSSNTGDPISSFEEFITTDCFVNKLINSLWIYIQCPKIRDDFFKDEKKLFDSCKNQVLEKTKKFAEHDLDYVLLHLLFRIYSNNSPNINVLHIPEDIIKVIENEKGVLEQLVEPLHKTVQKYKNKILKTHSEYIIKLRDLYYTIHNVEKKIVKLFKKKGLHKVWVTRNSDYVETDPEISLHYLAEEIVSESMALIATNGQYLDTILRFRLPIIASSRKTADSSDVKNNASFRVKTSSFKYRVLLELIKRINTEYPINENNGVNYEDLNRILNYWEENMINTTKKTITCTSKKNKIKSSNSTDEIISELSRSLIAKLRFSSKKYEKEKGLHRQVVDFLFGLLEPLIESKIKMNQENERPYQMLNKLSGDISREKHTKNNGKGKKNNDKNYIMECQKFSYILSYHPELDYRYRRYLENAHKK